MKKKNLVALMLGAVMACTTVLGACDLSTGDLGKDEQTGSTGGGHLTDPPTRGEASGNQPQDELEYYLSNMSAEEAQAIMNAYRVRSEEEQMEYLGIDKDDYVWTIVSLKGDSVLDKYTSAKSTVSVADYVRGDGKSHRETMLSNQKRVQDSISQKIDVDAEFSYSYTLTDNGFAAWVKYGDVSKIRALSQVSSVHISEQYAAPQSSGQETLYASEAPENGNNPEAGVGSFIAILDTSLDAVPEGFEDKNGKIYEGHPAFLDHGIDMTKAAKNFNDIALAYKGTVAFDWQAQSNGYTVEPSAEAVYYNNKLVYAYDYGNNDTQVLPYMIAELEHGNHTAGTAVGWDPDNRFYGIAPRAQFAFMKVFYEDTVNWVTYSNDIDIAAAIEDSIILGVDAINISLGSPRGFSVNTTSDSGRYIYEQCRYADLIGINVQAAVGNNFNGAYYGAMGDLPTAENPDYGALNSPASYESTLAVASYDGTNVDHYYGAVNEGSANSFKLQITDPENSTFIASETNPKGLPYDTYGIVYVQGEGTYSDFKNADVKDKIAVVTIRETNPRSNVYEWVQARLSATDQMANAIRAGAKGILYADRAYKTYRTILCNYDANEALPFGAISRLDLESLIEAGSNATVRFGKDLIAHNIMSAFSSWGPTNTLNIKPEIVGVGGNVYSSLSTPTLLSTSTGYGYLSGTSMAAPQVTGYATLLKAQLKTQYPGKTDRELTVLVNQLLMSTATTLSDLSGNIYSPRYQGAGAVNFEGASKRQAYLSVTGSTKAKMELGEDVNRKGVYLLNFNITNLDNTARSYTLSTDVMTDSLGKDGKTVTLTSNVLDGYETKISASGGTVSGGNVINVPANKTVSVAVTIKLTAEQKAYLNDYFRYGSYVEGFVRLENEDASVVDMSIPFLAFYGDWEESPLLDKTVYDEGDAYLFPAYLTGSYSVGFGLSYTGTLGQYQYDVPDDFYFVYEEDGVFVKGEKLITYEDIGYDLNRLAMGSKTGGFRSIAAVYFALLRNADSVEIFITNVDTGAQYAYAKFDQLGRASFTESYGAMLPNSVTTNYGASLPNNAKLKFTIRANYDNLGTTINVNDQVDFYITVDSEAPRLYKSTVGLVEQNGRTYLSLDVFDNHYLSAIGLYGEIDGVAQLLGDPLPVDTSRWVPNEVNTVVYDVTDYLAGYSGTLSVLLEDSAMNAVSYALTSIRTPLAPEEGPSDDEFATHIAYNAEMNIASSYSTDLDIVTQPANAKYTLSIVPVEEMEPEEQAKYTGSAYIDADNQLVVAQNLGYVKVKITSGTIEAYADVYIYGVDGEWVIVLEETGWARHYDETTGELDNTYYRYNPDHPDKRYYMVYAYQGEGSHVTVPDTYTEADGQTGGPVVAIGYGAFRYDYTLISITIPASITTIAPSAFEVNPNLQKVIFEKNSELCTIMSMAFEDCVSLKEIEIPKTVVQLESRAFYGCESLKKVTFSAYTKAEGARLREMQFSAFAYCPIEEFIFPETVESFGSAFSGVTTLKRALLPESLTSMGDFSGCTSLEEVYIPQGITRIPQGAFYRCTSLKKVNIPNAVTSIDGNAFYGCSSLTSLVLPKEVEAGVTFKIGDNAFDGCTRLIDIRLPNATTEIGKQAFYGCISLNSVYFDSNTSISSLGTDVFTGCIAFSEFIVHPANTSFMSDDGILYRSLPGQDGEYELYYVPAYKNVPTLLVRPDVASIRSFAFMGHTELETVMFSSGGLLYEIGDYAFANCVNLKIMNLENAKRLSTIGAYAFAGCTSLTRVAFPENLTTISSYAFYLDVYLEDVTFHDNITHIYPGAFAFCIRFEGTDGKGTLKLPARLTYLGASAFVLNRSLYKVDMSACYAYTGESGEGAFESCYALREVILPTSLLEIPQSMFGDCPELEKVNLGDTRVDTIRGSAFAGCTSLKQITLPETLEILYSYAFAWSGLTGITLPDKMVRAQRQLWAYAFAGCTNLTDVHLPSEMPDIPSFAFAETAIKEFTVPRGVTLSGLSTNAFYLCSMLERFYVEEGNENFAVTKDGILYRPGDEKNDAKLLICPPNLQADVLELDDIFTEIPTEFFELTTGIRKIVIPKSVKRIRDGAFYYSSIEEVEFEQGSDLDFDPYNDVYIFAGCTSLTKVVLPDHATCIPLNMFSGCVNLTDIVLPESVLSLYDDAFAGCTSLREINLENVEFLGGSVFMFCESLKKVHLGKNFNYLCTDINYTVFEGCSGLEEITVDKDNKIYKDIDGVLFDKTGSVLYVYPASKAGSTYVVPEGVTKVDEMSFGYNRNLTTVVLPETLKVVGTFAFYHAEKLTNYIFLSTAAPVLEGQYASGYGTLYGNFYSFYTNVYYDDEVNLKLYTPKNSTGYDMWLYGYFFKETYTVEDGVYTSPSQGDGGEPDDNVTPPASGGDFGDRLRKRIDELSANASESLKEKLEALWDRFDIERWALWDGIEEADAFEEYENAFIAEAENLCNLDNELFAVMWLRIHEIYDTVSALRAKNVYSEDNEELLDTMAYSAQYVISSLDSLKEIEYYYGYYLSLIRGIPAVDGMDAFNEYLESAQMELETKYNDFMENASLYNEDVIAYVKEKYEEININISMAFSTGIVDDEKESFIHIVDKVVKKAERESFDADKAAQIARLNAYKEEDYEYWRWAGVGLPSGYIGMRDYIEQEKAKAEESFILEDIIEIMDNAVVQLNKQTSKLSSQKTKMLENLDAYIDNFLMYTYLFDDEKVVLRGIVADVAAQIEAATTVAGAQEALDRGFERIWNYYEYNQKAHTEYRRAEEAFAALSGELREQALKELRQISWRAAENWLTIRALIEKYCGSGN